MANKQDSHHTAAKFNVDVHKKRIVNGLQSLKSCFWRPFNDMRKC